jgi:predicted transcriptional regulator
MNRSITIELDDFHAAELEALAAQLETTPGQVVALALDQFGHEPQDYTPEQIAMIEEGLAQIARGEVVAHEELFARLDKKYGL